MADEHYDAIVIGTSQGGRFLPIELAKAGQKVALVERDQLGGVCVNRGCTPTKTMVASARLAYQARRGAEYGVAVGPVSVDLAAVRERKRAMVAGARQNYASRLGQDGLDLIEGEAHFTGPNTVEIAVTDGGTREISAPVIVIDTGTRPRPLAIAGADDVPVLDSTSIMELDQLPQHLIVVGGGYIGLEFGQMFRRFGSEVTIIQHSARLLTNEDDDVSDEVASILRDDGITVLTSSTPVKVEPADGGRVRLTVRTKDGERHVEGSHLLSGIGRIPNTEALTPEAAGVRLDDRGFIEVDEYLQTSAPGVYAMGDVTGSPAFTHSSYDDYRILHANLIKHQKTSTRDRIVPYAVFIDPQLGRVGMTEREARAQGRAIRVAKLPMNAVIRALETGETRGFMKAVIDAGNGQILGCAILGSEGGEIMTMIQVAMLGKLTDTAMANAIFAHPLLAEGLNTLFTMQTQKIPESFIGVGYTKDRAGLPLEAVRVRVPHPTADQVLIRVAASSLNPLEYKLAELNFMGRTPPVVLGLDLAGVVVAVGDGVSSVAVGDEVVAMADLNADGGWVATGSRGGESSYAVTRQFLTARKPQPVSFRDAAALPICFLSAYAGLYGAVKAGDTVYIPGGGGGVGHLAVQMAARALGAGLVISSGSTPQSIALARQSGAHHVFDYKRDDIAAEIAKLTDGQGVDLVFDATYSEQGFVETAKTVRREGTWTVLGVGPGKTTRLAETHSPVDDILAERGANRVDVNLLTYFSEPATATSEVRAFLQRGMDLAMEWAAQGVVVPHIGQTIDSSLDEINAGLQSLKAGHGVLGKVAVIVDRDLAREPRT